MTAPNTEKSSPSILLFVSGRMKFDVIVMNPPYQAPKGQGKAAGMGGSGSAHSIWPKFVDLSLDICSEGGHLCLVHPSMWRGPESKLWKKISPYDIKCLSIHTDQDGLKTFGATTRYDWYVLHKNKSHNLKTIIRDEKGINVALSVKEWGFLPNHDFELVKDILASEQEETTGVICDYSYAVNILPKHIGKTKTKARRYPLIHATPKTEEVRMYWTERTDRGHFGIPKVIFGDARHITNAIVDDKGEYGMTHCSMALPISSRKEGEQIKKALESDRFNDLLKACRWSNFRIDYRMFKYFKKDFWKYFV